MHPNTEKENYSERDKAMRTSVNHISRKINKISNTTSTSLQKYVSHSSHQDQNATVKTAFYDNKDLKRDTIVSRESREEIESYDSKIKEISQAEVISITDDETSSVKKKGLGTGRYLKRRGHKSIESRLSTTNYSNDDGLPPFNDPVKELKNILVEIKSDDWQVANEALIKLRRIIRHHAELLVSSTTKALIPDVVKLS